MTRTCYHCGSSVPNAVHLNVEILGASRDMCCTGCEAVSQAIIASGNEQFYSFRTDLNETPDFSPQALPDPVRDELQLYDNPDVLNDISISVDTNTRHITLVVEGITCAACGWLIEQQLSKKTGVITASLNLSQHRLSIEWHQAQTPLTKIIETIYSLGFKAHPYSPDQAQQQLDQEQKLAMRRMVLAGFASMQAMMFAIPLYVGEWSGMFEQFETFIRFASLAITTPVVLYSAKPFFVAFLRDLKTRHLTMDVPVSIAIGGAYLASIWSVFTKGPDVYFDSVCMFTFFLLLGRYLEMRARLRTGEAGNNLASLLPSSAVKLQQGEEIAIPVKQLNVGDHIRVRPGTTIPVDGIVVEGYSGVDESALTGEFNPISKSKGSEVIGSTLNVEATLDVQVTALGNDMQVSTVMRLLDRANQEKPAIAQMADQVAQYFVAGVLLVSALVFTVWYFIDSSKAFWIMLSVLVVTCPCALSLATPTALTAATGALRRIGLLITRGHVLEGLAKSQRIVFDKTGTLTTGQLSIQKIQLISGRENEALEAAAGLESHSRHPIANAFKDYSPANFHQVTVTSGQGIEGYLNNDCYRIGQSRFALQSPNKQEALPMPGSGQWILLSRNALPVAWFQLNDQIQSDAPDAIQLIKQQDLKTELLSGDTSDQVEKIAHHLQLDKFSAGVSPEGKVNHVRSLPASDTAIMVGDGINDVPVLAQAPISVAVGSASDLAKTHADVILLGNQIKRIPEMIHHARKTRQIIKQNLIWALLYNCTALPLAAFGLIPPYAAAIGMSMSSLVVVGNALRLNRVRPLSVKSRFSPSAPEPSAEAAAISR